MSWDDLTPFLVGTGPVAIVSDPDGTPNTILDTLVGGSVTVNWSFSGMASAYLAVTRFTVTLYADPVSPANKLVLGSIQVTGPGPNYSATITIPAAPAPNSLPPDAYRLTTLITAVVSTTGASLPIAGFIDGPIIQVRPGP